MPISMAPPGATGAAVATGPAVGTVPAGSPAPGEAAGAPTTSGEPGADGGLEVVGERPPASAAGVGATARPPAVPAAGAPVCAVLPHPTSTAMAASSTALDACALRCLIHPPQRSV